MVVDRADPGARKSNPPAPRVDPTSPIPPKAHEGPQSSRGNLLSRRQGRDRCGHLGRDQKPPVPVPVSKTPNGGETPRMKYEGTKAPARRCAAAIDETRVIDIPMSAKGPFFSTKRFRHLCGCGKVSSLALRPFPRTEPADLDNLGRSPSTSRQRPCYQPIKEWV